MTRLIALCKSANDQLINCFRLLIRSKGTLFIFCSLVCAIPSAVLAGHPYVQITDGNLTILDSGSISTRKALAIIAQKEGFKLIIYGESDLPVQEKIEGVPLVEGLKRLLQGTNYLLIIGKPNKSTGKVINKLIVNLGPGLTIAGTHSIGEKKGATEENTTLLSDDGQELENPFQIIDPEAERANLLKLEDENAENRIMAISSLSKTTDTEIISALANAMLNDQDPGVRAVAASALGCNSQQITIAPLAEALKDDDPWVRVNVIEALARIGGAEVIPYLEEAIDDDDGDVSNSAIMALREVAPEASVEFEN